MRFVVDMVYLLFAVGISPIVLYRVIKHKRYRKGWSQRFGKIKRRFPHKKCIWLHAVSVGEVNAAKILVGELASRFSNFEIVISSTTDTGFAHAMSLFGKRYEVFYFPFDLSWAMRRAFDRVRPSLCLLMELEVWPNFVQIAQQLDTPVIVVNGRISDDSFAHYKKIRPVLMKTFGKLSLVLAQTDEYARRFKELGCPSERVLVTGSLKYDTAQIADRVDGSDALAAQLGIGRERLWVAGATGNDEEAILLDVYQNLKRQKQFADLRLAIVPRKPERFDEVAQLIEQSGFSVVRYSQIKNKSASEQQEQPAMDKKLSIINNQLSIGVILGDTMGDLRKFYSLATIVFVGRSLVPMGGSDMMESAALGKCTIFGPYAFNFKQTVEALLAGDGAIMVKNKEELLQMLQKCLCEPDFARKIAENGQIVIRKNQGATVKSIEKISKFLNTN
jgi:3-deoxy-D-manno-octulosonic-acid transferase